MVLGVPVDIDSPTIKAIPQRIFSAKQMRTRIPNN
jgi:hypothetical protein